MERRNEGRKRRMRGEKDQEEKDEQEERRKGKMIKNKDWTNHIKSN